ncbi:MAG: hypothetical protein BJ554DRAFT_7856, partial [Olpidium bornovanus]
TNSDTDARSCEHRRFHDTDATDGGRKGKLEAEEQKEGGGSLEEGENAGKEVKNGEESEEEGENDGDDSASREASTEVFSDEHAEALEGEGGKEKGEGDDNGGASREDFTGAFSDGKFEAQEASSLAGEADNDDERPETVSTTFPREAAVFLREREREQNLKYVSGPEAPSSSRPFQLCPVLPQVPGSARSPLTSSPALCRDAAEQNQRRREFDAKMKQQHDEKVACLSDGHPALSTVPTAAGMCGGRPNSEGGSVAVGADSSLLALLLEFTSLQAKRVEHYRHLEEYVNVKKAISFSATCLAFLNRLI